MADAFRGLTIRIGADARPVKSALDSIKHSAGQTQQQLSKMSKALKFDPANLAALRNAMSLSDDKAQHMAMSLRTAATAMRQAAAESAGFGRHSEHFGETIAEAASKIKNVNANIQQTREHAKTVNTQLGHIYDSARKIVEQRLHAPFATAEQKAKLADNVIKQIQQDLMAMGPRADSAFAAMEKFITKATTDKKMNLAEKFNLGKTEADAKMLYETFKRLHSKSGELNSDLKALKNVAGFQALKTEVIAYESALRQAVTETARLKAEMGAMSAPGMARAKSELASMKEATHAAVEQARVMNDAYDAMPRNIEAARNKILATKSAQQALREQADAYRAAMKKIENSPGFDKAAASAQNVYSDFAKAKAEAIEAGVAVERVQQKIDGIKHQRLAFIGPQSEAELNKMNSDLDKLEHELDEVKQKANVADIALEKASRNKAYVDMAGGIARVNTELAELNARSSALNTFKNLGTGMRELGYGLYSTVTPALMMAGRYAIQAAEDIDSAYRDMRKTVNGTEEQYEHLKKAALDYSTTHVTSADQILEIEAMGGQLGLAADDLEAFATTISNLDIATNIDADTAAEQLGKMASVLGISADEYDNFGDSLVRLGNNMPVMESDIMTLMTRFMGMGKVVGMSADEMLGWSAAASATGQKSEAAGSSMQRFISNIETAVTGGGEKLEKFAEIAGMSADDFATKFRDNASGAMRDFIAGLGDMQRNGESVNQALKDLGINNVRDKQLLEGLAVQMANAADGASVLDQALKMSAEAYRGLDSIMPDGNIEKAGDAAREAAKKAEGFSGALRIMKNQAQVLGSTVADSVAPMIKNLGIMFGDMTDRFRSLPDGMKQFVVQLAAIVAAAGPVAVAFGTIIHSGANIAGFFSGLQKSISLAGAKVTLFAERMAPAIGPVTPMMSKAATAASGLGKALSFLGSTGGMLAVAAGATAATIAVQAIVDAFSKAADRAAEYEKATKGVADATNESLRLMSSGTGGFDDLIEKPQSAAKSYSDLVKAQAELTDRMNERNAAAKNEISMLNGAEEALSRYLNKTNLTVVEQQKLKTAVELLNEKYGQNISIVDLENGKLADNSGALMKNADAVRDLIEEKKRAARIDVLTANLIDQEQAADSAAASYAKATKDYQDFMNVYGKAGPDTYAEWGEMSGTVEELGSNLLYAKNAAKELLDASQGAESATKAQLDALAESADKANASVAKLVQGNGAVAEFFGTDTVGLQNFASEIEACGVTVDDFYNITSTQWAEILAQWSAGGSSMADILASVNVSTRSLGEQFSAEFQKMHGEVDSFNDKASSMGLTIDQFAQTLSGAGISAQQFAEMGIAGFDNLLAAAGNDLANIGAAVDLLNSQNIDPKNIIVTDEGTIDTTTGKLYTLDATAGTITDTKRVFRVEEDGTLTEITDQIKEADGEEVNIGVSAEDDGSIDEVQGKMDNVKSTADEGAEMEEHTDDGGSNEEVMGKLHEVQDFNIDDKNFSVSVDDNASGTLEYIQGLLAGINDKTVTVTTNHVSTGDANASGGISSAMLRAIPRHASGAITGIATRAMLTNVGWVGEAGAEAILNMRHAGGAIVPLSNRHYVRPFARAVASEMTGGGTTVVHNHYTINGLEYLPGSAVADAAERIFGEAMQQARMG